MNGRPECLSVRGRICAQEKKPNQKHVYVGLRIALPEPVPHEHSIQHFLNASLWFHRIYRGDRDTEGRGDRLKLPLGAGTRAMSSRGSGLGLGFLRFLLRSVFRLFQGGLNIVSSCLRNWGLFAFLRVRLRRLRHFSRTNVNGSAASRADGGGRKF